MLEKELSRFSASFMSNAKWRKLFSVINNGSLPISWCTWRMVGDKHPVEGKLPVLTRLSDSHVGDCGALNGPFPFKAIEWLLLPHKFGYRSYDNAPMKYITQDLKEIAQTIDSIGKCEYELTQDGLKIYGYKK